jgi:hypothetical protein
MDFPPVGQIHGHYFPKREIDTWVGKGGRAGDFGGFSQRLSDDGGSDPHPTTPKSRQMPTGRPFFSGNNWIHSGDVTTPGLWKTGKLSTLSTEFSTWKEIRKTRDNCGKVHVFHILHTVIHTGFPQISAVVNKVKTRIFRLHNNGNRI